MQAAAGRRGHGYRVSSLGVQAPGEPCLFELEEPEPGDGQFLVDTLFTGLSSGSELTYVKGTNPYLFAARDRRLGVFEPGRSGQRYPVRVMGYMEVGRVAVSRTPAVAEGELVAMAYGHKTGHTADPARDWWFPLPGGLDPLLGVYVAQMGPICANGLLHAAGDLLGPNVLSLGDGVRGRTVLVTGAGVIGLLTGLLAREHGAAAVAVADATPSRLRAAEALGQDPVDDRDATAWRRIKERWRHGPDDHGADVVFQCRGQATALGTALRALRPQGTVIDLAFYQGGAPDLRLGEEFHHNGLSVRCAQIDRVPRGLAAVWDRRRLADETIRLLRARGAGIREHLVTDVVPFEEAPALLADVAARRRHVLQAVFRVSA
jgi:NADPH-dependent curcumin reductase CurA